ncbi:MAG: hypothetical protein ABI661_04955 [Gammaproteobacteria bacterium]
MAEDNSVLARSRRARPHKTVEIGSDKYRVRTPNVGAMREFQKLQGAGNSDGAMSALFQECVLEDDGVTTIDGGTADALIDMPWVSRDLTTAILDLAGIHVKDKPGEGTAEKEPDAG